MKVYALFFGGWGIATIGLLLAKYHMEIAELFKMLSYALNWH